MPMKGSEILAEALKRQGVDTFFFIMGGPMLLAESSCIDRGLRAVDVRHEQAAAMMAHAYARLQNRPGICMGASGPGTTNLITGVAHAWADCTPVIAFGGSAPLGLSGRGAFQECDQLAMFTPITKWAARATHAKRIPELVSKAFHQAMSGKPGPVYIDLPGDVLYQDVDDEDIDWPDPWSPDSRPRPAAEPSRIEEIISLLEKAEKPVIVSGSGILWSDAAAELEAWVEASRHSVLHHAPKPGRDPGGPSILLPHRSFDRVPRGRSDHGDRHAHELHHRARGGTALQRRRDAGPDRHRCRRNQRQPAPRRGRHWRREGGVATIGRGGRRTAECRHVSVVARPSAGTEHFQAVRAGGDPRQRRVPDPPAQAVQGDPRVHRPRRHPRGRWPGNTELRPSIHPQFLAGAPAELGHLRHHGRRPAVRRRRPRSPNRMRRLWCSTATARSASTPWSSIPRCATTCPCW